MSRLINMLLLNENNVDLCTARRKSIKCCSDSMGSYGTDSYWTGLFFSNVFFSIIRPLHCESNFKLFIFLFWMPSNLVICFSLHF